MYAINLRLARGAFMNEQERTIVVEAMREHLSRIARLEETLMALIKSQATHSGLPPDFVAMLKADSWLTADAVSDEDFVQRLGKHMQEWITIVDSLPKAK